MFLTMNRPSMIHAIHIKLHESSKIRHFTVPLKYTHLLSFLSRRAREEPARSNYITAEQTVQPTDRPQRGSESMIFKLV